MRRSLIALIGLGALLTLAPAPGHAKTGKKHPPAKAVKPSPVAAAQAAAKSWLALMDAGKYVETWAASPALARAQVTKDKWVAAMQQVRAPLGAVQSRTLQSAKPLTNPPGIPAGQYVVLTYDTNFEKRGAVTETVIPMHDADGKWKVSGYFLK